MKRILLSTLLIATTISGCSLTYYSYLDSGYRPLDSGTMVFENVDSIDIDWINGAVNISNDAQDDLISISETEDKYPLYYKVDKETLYIKYVQSGTKNSVVNTLSKTLNVYLPLKIKNLTLDTVNTKVEAAHYLICDKLNVKMVNGMFNAQGIKSPQSSFDVVNTNIDIKNVSCFASKEKVLEHKLSIDTVNGSAILGIDEEFGYIVNFSTINGKYASYYEEEVKYQFSNQKVVIDFDSVNGNLNIVKNKVVE